MRHIVFEPSDKYPVAILIKPTSFDKSSIMTNYVSPFIEQGVALGDIVAFTLNYNELGKAPVKFMKTYLEQLLPALEDIGVEHIYCADADYFKLLCGERKADVHLGYVKSCKFVASDKKTTYPKFNVVLGVNYRSVIYNPENQNKLDRSITTLIDAYGNRTGQYTQPILTTAHYPSHLGDIRDMLMELANGKYPVLSCDIETASLRVESAGLASIAFSWGASKGCAFLIDYQELTRCVDDPPGQEIATMVINKPVRNLLKAFFENYMTSGGTLRFHNAPFDTKILIHELWMQNLLDTAGLLDGLSVITRNFHDTQIIAYLALNTTAEIQLGLKPLAHEYAGNYGRADIDNVLMIPPRELLEYNLLDACCTNWVYDKYYPRMVTDQQEELYYTLMLPSQRVITQVELTGMPLNATRVQEARVILEQTIATQLGIFLASPEVTDCEEALTVTAYIKDYQNRRDKAVNPDKIKYKDRDTFPNVDFNPGSPKHLQRLLFDIMDLPVLERTATRQAATGADVIKKLINHTSDVSYQGVLAALIEYSQAAKILNTFIVAFEKAITKPGPDGIGVVWLHGSFHLGGTVSGRMSSSDPNLQNLPAKSKYGKLIKSCFMPPSNWILAGADFTSLEDYVSALITKDPNKLKVYQEGYDGHCLRAFSYFPERLPGIVDTVDSINSIEEKFPEVRQDSKGPTFALTYMGTYMTLMHNFGFDQATARQIEKNYHDLYCISDQWVQDRLDQAAIDGYVTCAFGLRVRTPLIAKSLRNHVSTPHEATAEVRTAGNALGQSYGLLTNRACNEFMQKVWDSPYRFAIKPIGMIHDSIMLLMRDDVDVVEWVNRELIKSMQWQELPDLRHDTVKLGAVLELYHPDWAHPIKLPNQADVDTIIRLCTESRTQHHG